MTQRHGVHKSLLLYLEELPASLSKLLLWRLAASLAEAAAVKELLLCHCAALHRQVCWQLDALNALLMATASL
jgi:hypothetical protein